MTLDAQGMDATDRAGLNGQAPRCDHIDQFPTVRYGPPRMQGMPGPRPDLDTPAGVPDLRLGGLFRRFAGRSRQGPLPGDRPSGGRHSGAQVDLALVLSAPADGMR